MLKFLHKPPEFVGKWTKHFQEAKNVDLPHRGLKRNTARKRDKAVIQLFEEHPTFSLRKGQALLARRGINVGTMIFGAKKYEMARYKDEIFTVQKERDIEIRDKKVIK